MICALSSLKFILTFPTMAQMEETLNNHEELDIWFSNIKKWSIYDSCETRRVWLEVFGVLSCGWCWENFKRIASLRGQLITLGKAISRTDSFESMKMLIVTDVFNKIDQDTVLNLGDGDYRLMIREIGTAVQIVHNDYIPFPNTPLENMDSSGDIPGFEDLMASLEADNDMAQSNIRRDDPSMADTKREVAQQTPDKQNSNSNSKMGSVRPILSSNKDSIYSIARTKIVSFSQNGYSKELLKLSQQPLSLGNQQNLERLEAQKPPEYGTPDFNQVNDVCRITYSKASGNPKAVNIVEELPEEGEIRAQSNETVEPTPGFELQKNLKTKVAPVTRLLRTKKGSTRRNNCVNPKSDTLLSQSRRDFNEVLDFSERRGAMHNTASMRDMKALVQDLQFIDLEIDIQFTWMRKNSASRIDRILVDKEEEFSSNKLLHKVDKVMHQTAEVDCVFSLVWINLAPPKVEFFSWIALLGKLTKHKLLRKGIISDQDLICNFCGIHNEDLDHVLVTCAFSWSIWSRFIQALDRQMDKKDTFRQLYEAWLAQRINNKIKKKIWTTTFFAVSWSLWMKRNGVVFEQQDLDAETLYHAIKWRIGL
ncbi:hypothetical protein Cgig2_031237 [Carnegiea gigantea]|uniref:Reverse transcriptase zinc-binding domain-containing protein n=1 Tax=Carnegiea gigantea TaxID=171969 RepID=A0A9Q1QKT7_9CARY|nr:hypothetical protein Cgig2_031237 [Carnegiea gigantea]